jgi:hypothetical protein
LSLPLKKDYSSSHVILIHHLEGFQIEIASRRNGDVPKDVLEKACLKVNDNADGFIYLESRPLHSPQLK